MHIYIYKYLFLYLYVYAFGVCKMYIINENLKKNIIWYLFIIINIRPKDNYSVIKYVDDNLFSLFI